MKRFFAGIFLSSLLVLGGGAFAGDSDAYNPSLFEQKLKAYDPQLIEAARTYQRTVNMAGQLVKAGPLMSQALARQMKAENPSLSDAQVKEFADSFSKALAGQANVIEQMAVLLILDIFTKDELAALNDFYSTPRGQNIIGKFPQMMGRMPELITAMKKYVIPQAIETARDELRKAGADVKD